MLSGFVKWAVKSYFGDLLEDVDCNQLSLGLLRGFVELTDLTICKKGRILSTSFPIFIDSGHVDSLVLKAPLNIFGDESWYLSLTNISLNCSCKPLQNDFELLRRHRRDAFARKLSELARLEDSWKVESLGHAKIPWADLASSLLFQVIKNITVSIETFQCSIAWNSEQAVIVQAASISVEKVDAVLPRRQKLIRIHNLQISVQSSSTSTPIIGPFDFSLSVDITSSDESPFTVSWVVGSCVSINFCPQSCEVLSGVINDVGSSAEVFQLREDSLLCPVASHAKLWWQHAFWLVSTSCRRYSRFRLQRRLHQASAYSKAYYQWLKFEYVEIALKKRKEDVEILWKTPHLIHLRRAVLERFLAATKRLSQRETLVTALTDQQQPRSSSQGWLRSMSSWVGLGRSNSQPDLQSEDADILPSESTAKEEETKWKKKSVEISGDVDSLVLTFGSSENLSLKLQKLIFKSQGSSVELNVSSFDVISRLNNEAGNEFTLFKMQPPSPDAHALSVAHIKKLDTSSINIAAFSPSVTLDAKHLTSLAPVIAGYPTSNIASAFSNLNKFFPKNVEDEADKRSSQQINLDVSITTPSVAMTFSDGASVATNVERISLKTPMNSGDLDQIENDESYISGEELVSPKFSFGFEKVSVLSSSSESGSIQLAAVNEMTINFGSSKAEKQESNIVDVSINNFKVVVCQSLFLLGLRCSDVVKQLAPSLPKRATITSSSENIPKRRCLRCNLPSLSVVMRDEWQDLAEVTLSDVEVAADSLTSRFELTVTSLSMAQSSDELLKDVYIRGLSNGEEMSFLSLEVDQSEPNGSNTDGRIVSVSISDLALRTNPHFVTFVAKFVNHILSVIPKLDSYSENSPQTAKSSSLELVISLASLDLTLLPQNNLPTPFSRLSIKDLQALGSTASSWEVACDFVDLTWNDKEATTLVTSYSLPDSCVRLNFDSPARTLSITTSSIDVFIAPTPVVWLVANYIFALKSLLKTESATKTQQAGSKSAGILGINFKSEKTRLCLEGDAELAIGGISHRKNENLLFTNVLIKKLSTGVVVLDAPNIVFSSSERSNDEFRTSLFNISSDKTVKLNWSVLVENLLKSVITTYVTMASDLTKHISGQSSSSKAESKTPTCLEVNVSPRSLELAILDPFDPKMEVARASLSSPVIKFENPVEAEGVPSWLVHIEAQMLRILDTQSDLVMFEAMSNSEKSSSRSSRSSMPLSSSYPGVLTTPVVPVTTNALLKPLPPFPDFSSASLSSASSAPPVRIDITSEKMQNGHNKRVVLVDVQNNCSLGLTTKCLPSLLEAVGLGAKMFPVITVTDKFGRPMHKLQNEIVPSPDVFNFTLTANSTNCRLMSLQPGSTVMSPFVSALATDGVQLSLSSAASIHRLDGSFSATSVQLFDESREFGALYSCRLIASGLEVEFSKAGLPDYDLTKFQYEVLANVSAQSVSFVHTKRIFVSILDFVDVLMQNRERLGKECAHRNKIPCQELPGHGARLDLRFAFKNPTLIVPINYSSEKSLVLRFSETVYGTSAFAWQGEAGTNLCVNRQESSLPTLHPRLAAMKLHEPSASDGSSIYPCLLNLLRFDLKGLSVYDGTWKATMGTPSEENDYVDCSMYCVEVQRMTSWSTSPLSLIIHIERNLDGGLSRTAPDLAVACLFDRLDLNISREQATRIFVILDKNFGEDLGSPPPPAHHPENMTSWKNIEVVLYAQGCRVNFFDDSHHELAGVRLDPSALSFSRFSNNSRSIEFKYPEVFVSDIRTPLTLNGMPPLMAHPIANQPENPMQFEMSYSANNNLVRIGCLLSCVRVVVIDDFWQKMIVFMTAIVPPPEESQQDNVFQPHSRTVFAVGDDFVSRVPMPSQAIRRKSSSVKVSLHRTEICYLLPVSVGSAFGSRGFLTEITAMLVMSPTRSLTVNIPSFKTTKLSNGDGAGEVVAVLTNFIGDISHEQASGSDSPASTTPSEAKSVSHGSMGLGVLEVVLPPSDMRGEVTLGFLRIELNPQIIRLITSLLKPKRSSEPALSPTEPEPSKSPAFMSKLLQVYPELAKLKLSVSLIACNLTIDSTPVVAIALSDIAFEQNLFSSLPGSFTFRLACRYHNAAVSNWEPLIETWGCKTNWKYDGSHSNELLITATSNTTFNLNVTSALLELFNWSRKEWNASESFFQTLPDVAATSSAVKPVQSQRVRPCILVNKLELPLVFCVQQSDLWSTIDNSTQSGPTSRQGLIHALPNQEVEFGDDFSQISSLSLAVKVTGFQPMPLPIPIDAVGIVVRSILPEMPQQGTKGGKESARRSYSANPTRIMFRITLNRHRQKVIYAESAVRLINRLPHGLALTFSDSADDDPSQSTSVVTLDTGESIPLPLVNVYKYLWFRPLKPGTGFCQDPVVWQSVTQPALPENTPHVCSRTRAESRPYHCIVSIIKRQSHFTDGSSTTSDPWHVITISAPIAVRNLLPCEMTFELTAAQSQSQMSPRSQVSAADRLPAGRTARLTDLDAESASLNLTVKLEQFPFCTGVSVMVGRSNLFVLDEAKRPLRLAMTTERSRHGVLLIRVECSYWLYNNTNLPLIFRQHLPSLPTMDTTPYSLSPTSSPSSRSEEEQPIMAAGQAAEFEVARSVVPLMFSFDDEEWQFCQMRLGKGLHYPALKPIWSQKFSLVGGTTTRWLFASSSEENYVPERCYVVGLEVEQGRGEYENTTFVTFTARFQVVNHTNYPVCLAQHCLVVKSLPPFDDSTADGVVQVPPGSSMAFHWWRADAEPLASVRKVADNCFWSGGFDISSPSSFHVNMRDASGGCHLLHVEIISIGPMNCILLSDASLTPPPYRIDNFSEVQLVFHQKGTTAERLKTVVNPKSSLPYALDEPTISPKIVMSIVGGAASTGVIYDLDVTGEGDSLEYENFIFIELENTNLVLDVAPDGRRVIFAPMQVGRRSQLWRMTSTGILQNEGVLTSGSPRCVLDTDDHGIDPNRNTFLCLRQQDDRRRTAQTWTFTDDGRLTSVPTSILGVHGGANLAAHSEESRDALFGPNPMSRIVRKRLRPGSGVLCVSVVSDGPTRVLRVCDLRTSRGSRHSGLLQRGVEPVTDSSSFFRFQLNLPHGIGVSLVSLTEELAYITLSGISASYRRQPKQTESVRLSISMIQIDNQLLSTPCLVLLFSDTRDKPSRRSRRNKASTAATTTTGGQTTTSSSTELATAAKPSAVTTVSASSQASTGPALVISASRLMNSPKSDVIVVKNVSASVSRLYIRLEERFLWKVLQLFGFTGFDANKHPDAEATRQMAQAAQDSRFAPLSHRFSHIVLGKRLYFASLSIKLNRLDLGMATASAPLPADLRRIKRSFRVPLIQFSGAQVELETFSRHHVLVTWPLLVGAIKQHYSRQLRSQAGKIFGSVDFLGSPLGLFTDVTEGLSGLIRDANVSGLVRHVMHGISNSTARFTSTLSETLGSVASDVHYQAERDLIRSMGPSAKPSDHLVAGLVGFGHGVIGGVTSLFTHTYQGATQDGPIGLITGLSRGVIGTVTRPAAGFLDLAAGAAKAVSETAKTSNAPRIMGRVREPRCTSSLNGALGEYSGDLAEAQQFLFTLNSGRLNERLLAMECLVHTEDDRRGYSEEESESRHHRVAVMVTSDRVYVVRRYADPNSVLQLRYDTIRSCRVVFVNGAHHVELLFSRNLTPVQSSAADYSSLLPPEMDAMALNAEAQRSGYLIRGTSEAAAQRIATMVNCARQLYERSRLFVSAAVLLASPESSTLLYGYNGWDFGNNEIPIVEFDG